MARALTARPLDTLYLLFFIIHIPVILLVDLLPFYPAPLRPTFTTTLRQWYITTYHDRFFVSPPAWFNAFLVLEGVYHLPLSVWAIRALATDDPMVPVQLLGFAMLMATTTLTCVVDAVSWEGYSAVEVRGLMGLYVPYLGLAVVMGVDMFLRLRKVVLEHASGRIDGVKKRV